MRIEKQIERSVTELTSSLCISDYVDVMRWLSDWAEGQADAAEYTLDGESGE